MPLSETKQQEGSDMSTPIEPNPFVPPRLTVALSAVWLAMALSLSACGGGSAAVESSPVTLSRLAQGGSAPGPASASDAAEAQAQAAEPQSTDAVDTEQALDQLAPGAIAPKSAYASGQVARKAAAMRIPAYRFYNTRTGAHFYTTSEEERTNEQEAALG
jgi:hypothetical protein